MNDDQRLLASAALDGAVTREEQARAEGDPEIVAEIERLRAVRTALQVDSAPDAERREASIAAALATFDEAERPAAPPPPSMAARRRARWMAPLAAAAAVAVIAVGAIVVVQRGGSEDDADLASTEQTVVSQAVADSAAAGEAEVAPEMADTDDDAGGAAEEAPAATNAATSRESQLTVAQPTAPAVETLRSPDELAAFAQRPRDEAAAAGNTICAAGRSLGTAFYIMDGVPVFVEVYEITEPHEAIAFELERCNVIARAPLP